MVLFYIQLFWLNMLQWNRGCVYVCVCVCDSATAQTDGWILMKFSTNDLTDICEVRFSRILKFPNDDVIAAFLHFFVGALSRSQFCSNFLQNLTQDRKLSSTVCYLKSARSVGNFRQYGRPRFRKKIKMAAKNKIFETRQVRCLFRLKLTCWLRIW